MAQYRRAAEPKSAARWPDRPTAGHTSRLTPRSEVTFRDLTDERYFPRGRSRVFCMSLQSAGRHGFYASLIIAKSSTKAAKGLWLPGFSSRLVSCGSYFTVDGESRLGFALYHETRNRQLWLHRVTESGSWTPESSMARLGLMIAELNLHDPYFCAAGDFVALQSCLPVTARTSLLDVTEPFTTERHGSHRRPPGQRTPVPRRSRYIYHRELARGKARQTQSPRHHSTSFNPIMHFSSLVLLASSGAASASFFSNPTTFDFTSLIKRRASCPTYWQQISKDLNTAFLDSNGQCNANARAAVRYAFHDAGPYSTKFTFVAPAGGGADGSLLLNAGEMSRGENGGLESYNTFIGDKLKSYRTQFGSSVGAADLIQFASRYFINFTEHSCHSS